MCLVPANPDISGIGVRIAIYLQILLGFIPAIWAMLDWEVTDYELESAETQSTTNLVLAFAILISCIVQALTLGLTNYHATIVLSLSWMNNTNAFIYFLLYVHYKSQGVKPQVAPQWSSWVRHVKDQTKALFTLPAASPGAAVNPPAAVSDREQAGVTDPEGNRTEGKDGKSGVKVLFKRVALLLGSLHLTLMAGLGIWLWSDPRSFGISDASCAVDFAHLAVVGARVPFSSGALRIFSLTFYSLFLLPGINLLLPMAAFLGLYLWHRARWVKVTQSTLAEAEPPANTAVQPLRMQITKKFHTAATSPVFAIYICLGFLFAINIVFIADIELTLARNRGLQGQEETKWGFGQILAVLLVFLPFRDVIEMVVARRQRRQEEQIKRQELNAAWIKAILEGNIPRILDLVEKVADPNTKTGDQRTALEVAIGAKNRDAMAQLIRAGADANLLLHDGRTTVEAAAFDEDWETLEVLCPAADINARNQGGQTALEVAIVHKKWEVVKGLVGAGADVNATKHPEDGRPVLEVATDDERWDIVHCLANANTDLDVAFQGKHGSALQAACTSGSLDIVKVLLENKADPHLLGGEYGSVLQAACARGSLDIVKVLLENKADPHLLGGHYGSVLQAACAKGSLDIVKVLLENKADPHVQGGHYGSVLQAACASGSLDIVKVLLENKADPNLLGGEYGSVLQAACARSLLDIVKVLLENKADPNLLGGQYGSGLQAACVSGSLDIVKVLLENKADPNLQGGHYGSALQAACTSGSLDIVKVLLENKADPHVQGGHYGSALQAACARGSLDIVKVLLENKAEPNLQAGGYGFALQAACASGSLDIVKVLLENKADPHLLGGHYGSALQAACTSNSLNIVKVLLENDADPNLLGGHYGSALQAACARGSLNIVKVLLENKADPHVQGGHYGSALHAACLSHYFSGDIVQVLLKYGADPNIRDPGSPTLLREILDKAVNDSFGRAQHFSEITALLQRHGAIDDDALSNPLWPLTD